MHIDPQWHIKCRKHPTALERSDNSQTSAFTIDAEYQQRQSAPDTCMAPPAVQAGPSVADRVTSGLLLKTLKRKNPLVLRKTTAMGE